MVLCTYFFVVVALPTPMISAALWSDNNYFFFSSGLHAIDYY